MKIHVTFLFLWIFVGAFAQKKAIYTIWYDDQDRLYAGSWDQKERVIYFMPYLINKPYEDTTANCYSNQDIAGLYHQQNPPNIARRIDPQQIKPVRTKDVKENNFVFFVDLRTMTQTDMDSCQAFLRYFYEHKPKEERVFVYCQNKDNSLYYSFCNYGIPTLGKNEEWVPTLELGKVAHQDIIKNMQEALKLPVDGMDFVEDMFIYLGRVDDFGSTKDALKKLNTTCRDRRKYMNCIDLSAGKIDSPFREMAKIAGGAAMKLYWGKEALTNYITNDLVVYYLWKEVGMEDNYSDSQQTPYPAPQEPKPSNPPLPKVPSDPRPVILGEPVKKPLPRPVLRN